jgi:hypothetical protein
MDFKAIPLMTMKMHEINELLDQLDGSGSAQEFAAVKQLRELNNFPRLLLDRYKSSKNWKARSSCVYHAIRYAKNNNDAFQIGLAAINDRSKIVRYRAFMLLAYSLNKKALADLQKVLDTSNDETTKGDALAAIDAIRNQNHHYFVDRDHSGLTTMNF